VPITVAARRVARIVREDLRFATALRPLPRPVAIFFLRARLRARRTGDEFSLSSATRPADLAAVLALAAGARHVVELGTGTGWTTIALCLADPARTVTSLDPFTRPQREGYLALAGPGVAARLRWIEAPGTDVPHLGRPVDLLYIDSSHEREPTVAEFRAWRPLLDDGAVVIFDDYTHQGYPGVAEAVSELGLGGETRGTVFVHRVGT
jgi:predicted O-methyltransferase YrrM